VIDWNQRRPLAAGSDVGGAEIVDHGPSQTFGQVLPVAKLHGEPLLGPVKNSLSVEPDDIDFAE
jgi:hypothetical protein